MNTIVALFDSRLDEVENQARLLDKLKILGSLREAQSIKRTKVGRAALDLRQDIKSLRSWETIGLDGCILSLCGEFELATRDLAERTCDLVGRKFRVYSDVPEAIRNHNERIIGQLLRTGRQKRASNVDYVQVIQDLARCLTKGKPTKLYSAGFAVHEHNLKAADVAEMFGHLKVSDLWRRIGRDPRIMFHFGTSSHETTANAAREKLNSFVEIRNQIAHRGPNYQTVGPTVVMGYVAFLGC